MEGCRETTCCSVLTMSFDTVQYNHEAEQTQKHSPFKHTMLMLLLTTVNTDLLCPFCYTEASNHPQAQWKHHGLSHPSVHFYKEYQLNVLHTYLILNITLPGQRTVQLLIKAAIVASGPELYISHLADSSALCTNPTSHRFPLPTITQQLVHIRNVQGCSIDCGHYGNEAHYHGNWEQPFKLM